MFSASETFFHFPFRIEKGCQLIFFGQMIKMKHSPRNKQKHFVAFTFEKVVSGAMQ